MTQQTEIPMSDNASIQTPVPGALQARYGNDAPRGPLPATPVLDAMLAHRTVRAFDSRPLPTGTLEAMVAAAQSAPTSSNLQTWSVIAVKDADRRDRLSKLSGNQAQIRECPLLLVFLADLSRIDRLAERKGEPAGANRYMEMFLVAAIDAALAAQNALVAAEAMGLGTCYIGAMRNHPEDVARELNLPADVSAVFGLCVGWPDATRPASVKPRLAQEAVLFHERYDAATEAGAIERYESEMRTFQVSQRIAEVGWSKTVLARSKGIEGLSGRHVLKQTLQRMGFGLE
jgi:nitroreductase